MDEAQPLNLVMPGRSLPSGSGWSWIKGGWALFAAAPLMWIVFIVVLVICSVVFNFVPILGSLAWQVLSPVIGAGLVIGCRSLETSGELELEHLFAGFKTNLANLLILGALYVLGGLIILGIMVAFVGTSIVMAALVSASVCRASSPTAPARFMAAMKSAKARSTTKTSFSPMHSRLLSQDAPSMMWRAAWSRSAQGSTTTGGFPGPAAITRFPAPIAARTTAGPPVTQTRAMSGWRKSAWVASMLASSKEQIPLRTPSSASIALLKA